MGVLDRLRRITGEDKEETGKTAERRDELRDLRQRIETIMARRPQQQSPAAASRHPPLQELIGGKEIVTSQGAFFLATEERKSHHCHGNRPVGDLNRLNMAAAALLANNPAIAHCRIDDALFLDTETTGLSGGTGTLAFMIGVGWFAGDAFITRQIFIRDYAEERAALQYLAEITGTRKFLVSFNGKAFDVNLLAARYILNRLKNPLENLPHLDLLFPSRRLCGHRLENSRLVTLEQQLFGLYRDDDIPGMEIPARYFAWLHRRDPRLVAAIFKHNHLDILSLAALAVHLAELMSPPHSTPAAPPKDRLAAARLLCERGEDEQATCLLQDLDSCDHPSVRVEARKLLSLLWKRQGKRDKAAFLWEGMLKDDPADPFAAVELAKWYEHGCRNYQTAHDLIAQMLARTIALNEDEKRALEHRLKRLQAHLPRSVPG